MGGKVYAKDCPLRHCEAHAMLPSLLSPPQLRHYEKSFSFSWQSINLHTLRFTTSVIARNEQSE